jgi:hypothetical protein
MEELFKELIKEWHIASFPNFIKRDNTDYLHQSYSNIYAII